MTQPAWLTKWQAREALQNGQPEEAHRLLETLLAEGNRRAWALQGDVVRGYLERAEKGLKQDQVEAVWADLKALIQIFHLSNQYLVWGYQVLSHMKIFSLLLNL